jgi:hypothetical protein
MSQYRFTTSEREFVCGWDRPLQYFFLTVTDRKTEDFLFSNLDLEDPGMTIAQVKATCLLYGHHLPHEVEDEMLIDQKTGRANVTVCHDWPFKES